MKDILNLCELFNSAVKNTMAAIDEIDISNCNDNPSLTSKYLHFHLPNIVFINDNYSFNRARQIFAKKFVTDKNLKNSFKYILEKIKLPTSELSIDFAKHLIRCYLLSIHCAKDERLTPRNVDNLLLRPKEFDI